VILVHILCLDDCLATTIMPQPAEITQFIFGQPLSRVFERTLALAGSQDERITNSGGDPFDLEGCYALYGGEYYIDNLPGGRVDRHKNKAVIVLHINTFAHFWALATDLLACEEFLPDIGDPSKGGNRSKSRTDRFGFLPIQSLDFDVLLFSVVARGPACPERMRFALVLRDLMIEAVITHEIGHAMLGHLDFKRTPLTLPIPLESKPQSSRDTLFDPAILRAIMEYEADDYSSRSLAVRIKEGVRFGLEADFGLPDETWIVVHLLARYFVAFTWIICDIIMGRTPPDPRDEWHNYPPSYVRMFTAMPSYQSFLVDQLGYDAIYVESAMHMATKQLRSLTGKFDGLSMLSFGIDSELNNKQIARLEEYMERLNYEEAISTYRFRISGDESVPKARANSANIVNHTIVTRDILTDALNLVMRMGPEDRRSFVSRAKVVSRLISDRGLDADGGALGMAVVYRLEALAALAPDDSPFGVVLSGNRAGMDYNQEHLLAAAAAEPLTEKFCFEAVEFWRRVIEYSAAAK